MRSLGCEQSSKQGKQNEREGKGKERQRERERERKREREKEKENAREREQERKRERERERTKEKKKAGERGKRKIERESMLPSPCSMLYVTDIHFNVTSFVIILRASLLKTHGPGYVV